MVRGGHGGRRAPGVAHAAGEAGTAVRRTGEVQALDEVRVDAREACGVADDVLRHAPGPALHEDVDRLGGEPHHPGEARAHGGDERVVVHRRPAAVAVATDHAPHEHRVGAGEVRPLCW